MALPVFKVAEPAPLVLSVADRLALHGGDPLAVDTWFAADGARPGAARTLGLALREAEVLRTRRIAAAAPWPSCRIARASVGSAACRALRRRRPTVDCRSSCRCVDKLDLTQPLAGLLVDEWVEIVPSAQETTAIAFQYDPPDAFAPQAILLAVPPVLGRAVDAAAT